MDARWAASCSVGASRCVGQSGAGAGQVMRAQEGQEVLTLMLEQMQQQAACLLKHVTFNRRNLCSHRSLNCHPCFIIKADKGPHTVYAFALSLACKDIGGCPLLGLGFLYSDTLSSARQLVQ